MQNTQRKKRKKKKIVTNTTSSATSRPFETSRSFPRVTSRGPPSWFPSLWFGGLGGATASCLAQLFWLVPLVLLVSAVKQIQGCLLSCHIVTPPTPPSFSRHPPPPTPPPIFHPQAIVGYFDIFFDNGCSNKVSGGGGTSYLTKTQLCSRFGVFAPPPPLPPGERRRASVLADC